MSEVALEAFELGMRYRHTWALRGCRPGTPALPFVLCVGDAQVWTGA
jgi:hypothetical protein